MSNSDTQIFENGAEIVENFSGDSKLFGWVPIYPIFMLLAVFSVILAAGISFSKKKIPLKSFRQSLYLVIPFGILGASLFGKLNTTTFDNWKVWELFYFWRPGMSLFGSFLFGGTAGIAWFWKKTREEKISILVYADCIVPHIALGQAIGRWGNLFNHEILGKEISNENMGSITWLPDFIWKKLFYLVEPTTGEKLTEIQFREPLFLYESFANLLIWVLLVFIVFNIGKFFSKKPWKVNPSEFPCVFNKKNKWSKIEDISESNLQRELKLKWNKERTLVRYSLNDVWNKAYYLYQPDDSLLEPIRQEIIKSEKSIIHSQNRITDLYFERNNKKSLCKKKFEKNKLTKSEFNQQIKEMNKCYKKEIREQKQKINKFLIFWKLDSSKLYNLNNPNNYLTIKSGFTTGIYIVLYSFVRMILEARRNIEELTIKWSFFWDYVLMFLFLVIGIILAVISQFLAPIKWRKEGWLYEKSY